MPLSKTTKRGLTLIGATSNGLHEVLPESPERERYKARVNLRSYPLSAPSVQAMLQLGMIARCGCERPGVFSSGMYAAERDPPDATFFLCRRIASTPAGRGHRLQNRLPCARLLQGDRRGRDITWET